MIGLKEQRIYRAAVNTYGEESQVGMMIEEMSELTQALCKMKRGKDHNITEELADVEIMLNQLKLMFGQMEVEEWKIIKLARLDKMLREGENNG